VPPTRGLSSGPLAGNVISDVCERHQEVCTMGIDLAIDHYHGQGDVDAATTVTVPRPRVIGVLSV